MNVFSRLKFILKKPKVIIIVGNGRKEAKSAIFWVLKQHFKIGSEILIVESDLKNSLPLEEFKFLAKKSQLPILVITLKERKDLIPAKKIAKILPPRSRLILNFDDEAVREIEEESGFKETIHAPEGYKSLLRGSDRRSFTFGFQEGADFRATDIKLNSVINFKINYKGNIVPVWLAPSPRPDAADSKEQIYSVLAAAAAGTILGLNLVEISHALKNYRFSANAET